MKEKIIYAVVVTYNRKKLLKENIVALKNQVYKNFKVLIIDNNSTDNTYEYIKDELTSDIEYINTKKNLGGAGGFSFGIQSAVQRGADYVWIMDDDTIPEKEALEELVKTTDLLNGEFGFLASKVLWKDREQICLMNKQAISDDWIYNLNYLTYELIKVKVTSFVSCFINRKAIMDVGLPITEFFIYGDDVEYTTRISSKYQSFLVNKSVVIHKIENNISIHISQVDKSRIFRYKYMYRNGVYIAKKKGIKEFFKTNLRAIKAIGTVIKKSKDSKIKRISTIVSGIISGWTFNPKINYVEKRIENETKKN